MTNAPIITLAGGTQVVAADADTAARLLTTPDAYIAAQSPFDRSARLGLPQASLEVTPQLFLDYLSTQVLGWSGDEIASLTRIMVRVKPVLAGIDAALPETVWLVKTTGREEGAAAYTRRTDTIVLPAGKVASLYTPPPGGDALHPGQSDGYLAGIVTHEFFHILSKNNPDWRGRLYGLVHYRLLPNAIELPDHPWADGLSMRALAITNPDAPLLNVAIDLVPPGGDRPVAMTPVLISSAAYRRGSFFDTLEWLFLAVAEGPDGQWAPVRAAGKPVTYPAKDLRAQYLDLVGHNFGEEIFHPDEILAQSFVTAAGLPSLPLLGRIHDAIWPGSD